MSMTKEQAKEVLDRMDSDKESILSRTTGNRKLGEALKELPSYCFSGWSERLKFWDRMVLGQEHSYNPIKYLKERVCEYQGNLCMLVERSLGVSEHFQYDASTQRERDLISFAAYRWAEDCLNRRMFLEALLDEKFAYVTNGHTSIPDSYGIYHNHSTSPTGVIRVFGGPKNQAYANLIQFAEKRLSISRSFA